ncbi:hypothetical protein INT46_003609 [Mucor plumbeus]|uniref:Uncharacterized protein n=1 Tax=Mucor plumbeus TaxID=97098 RepID=A0A8H7R9B2_9FUNG|nr:hypothetical protein INT46_003609 [Mucor plumbeus]
MCSTCANRKCHVQLAGNSLERINGEALKKYLLECSLVKPLHVIKHEANRFALVHFASELDAAIFYYIYCIKSKVVCKRIKDIAVNPSLINNQPVTYSKFQVQPRITSSTGVFCRCRCDQSETFIANSNSTITTTNTDVNSNTATVLKATASTSDGELYTNTTTDANSNSNTTTNPSDTANISDDGLVTSTTTDANININTTTDVNINSNTTTDTNTNTNTNINTTTNASTTNDDLDINIENAKLKLTRTLKRKVQEMERLSEEISKLQKKIRYLEEFQNL